MKKWEAAYIAGILDGEGSITLTRMHQRENRRPCISISSNDKEMLDYIQKIAGGDIYSKKNYKPDQHLNSYTLYFKKKKEVFNILERTSFFLRVKQKRNRATWILKYYNEVTPRNGKYSNDMLRQKILFEENFFKL